MYIQRKIIFLFLCLMLFIYRNVNALDGSDQESVKMPAHMGYVPTDTGIMNRLIYYMVGITLGCVKKGKGWFSDEFEPHKVPRILPEMISTDLLHEGINASCKAQGINLDDTSHTVKAVEKNSCRLAAYILVQKMKEQHGCDDEECSGSPDFRWKEKTCAIAEDAAAEVLWACVKDISCRAGLSSKIENVYSRVVQVLKLDKLSVQTQTVAKGAAEFVGKRFIKAAFARPLFCLCFEDNPFSLSFSLSFEL